MFQSTSDTWKAVEKRLKKDRSELVEELILAISPENTAKLRGKILMIDEVLTIYPKQLRPGNED